MNASCMLYSFKIVSPMRQGLLTSALSATNTTFNAREANIAVAGLDTAPRCSHLSTLTTVHCGHHGRAETEAWAGQVT